MSPSFGPGNFREETGVSRETLDRFRRYEALLRKWQRRINLVSARTLDAVWSRHFLDSAQLLDCPLPPAPRRWLDMGSGAGFPGLVIAVMTGEEVHLAESDRRKAAFLREAARRLEAPAHIHADRVEALSLPPIDVITARALAPLPALLRMARPFQSEKTVLLALKGQTVDRELTDATKCWNIRYEKRPSRTSETGAVLVISQWRERPGHENTETAHPG